MNKTKKTTTLIPALALAAALVLTGCDGAPKTESQTPDSSIQSSSVPDSSSSAGSAAASKAASSGSSQAASSSQSRAASSSSSTSASSQAAPSSSRPAAQPQPNQTQPQPEQAPAADPPPACAPEPPPPAPDPPPPAPEPPPPAPAVDIDYVVAQGHAHAASLNLSISPNGLSSLGPIETQGRTTDEVLETLIFQIDYFYRVLCDIPEYTPGEAIACYHITTSGTTITLFFG